MKEIEYVAPKTLDQAKKLLAEKGEHARMLAGGTDLLVQIRSRRHSPDLLVDAKDIPELNQLSYDPQKGLEFGAAIPCYQIYQNEAISSAYPGLIDAAAMIGGIQIQGRASVGGNLCNAAPSADAIPSLIVLGAVCNVAGSNGNRQILAEDFCTSPGRNVLQPEELLISLYLPPPVPHSGANYLRFIPRNEMDIAVAGVGTSVVLDEAGKSFVSARIALASVAPTPVFAKEASDSLAGKPVSEEAIEEAAQLAMAAPTPISDMRGTVQQRVHLIGVLTRRTLRNAIQRAREE